MQRANDTTDNDDIAWPSMFYYYLFHTNLESIKYNCCDGGFVCSIGDIRTQTDNNHVMAVVSQWRT